MALQQRRRNKQHTPRPISFNGGLFAIAKLHDERESKLPLDPHAMTDLGIAYWAAFHQMLHGKAREEDWTMVVCSLNVALILCEQGFGREYEPYLVKALDGSFRCKMRADGLKVWRYDGEAINAIREALEVHDEQVKLATKGELRDALLEVLRRIESGNVYEKSPTTLQS